MRPPKLKLSLRFFLSFGLVFCFQTSFAETLYLKNGRKLKGTIVKTTQDGIVVDLGNGRVTIALDQLLSIENGESMPFADGAKKTTAGTPAAIEPKQDVSSAKALINMADRLFSEVSSARGLKIVSSVKKKVADKATILSLVDSIFDRQYSSEEFSYKETAMKMLGLIPRDVSLKDVVVQSYSSQLAGMYDQYTHTLYIADWIPAMMQSDALAHELVHALQDQHFGLNSFLEGAKSNSESQLARQCVIEGDAMALTQFHGQTGEMLMKLDLSDIGASMPKINELLGIYGSSFVSSVPYVFESMLFPYMEGGAFVNSVYEKSGWPGVNKLYKDPPKSSEQIIHPEKYLLVRDEPVEFDFSTLASVFGEGWSLLDEDSMGEFSIRFLIKQALGEQTAEYASAGWGGDQYQLYRNASANHEMLVWLLAWDSPQDSKEFADAMETLLRMEKETDPLTYCELCDYILERRYEKIILIKNCPKSQCAEFINLAWEAASASR